MPAEKSKKRVRPLLAVPQSVCRGIVWPAIPGPNERLVLALAHQLEKSEWYPLQILQALQLHQLTNLLRYAAEAVPFYKVRLQDLKLGEAPIVGDAWRQVPVLRREDLRENAPYLLSRRFPESQAPVADIWTSGSSGQPVSVKSTRVTTLLQAALHLRYHLWHGRDGTGTVAAIRLADDAQLKASREGRAGAWMPGYGTGRIFYHSIRTPVTEQLAWLAELRPDYLTTYPSNLKALLAASRRGGTVPVGLKQVSTLGEVLDPEVRDECRSVWGAEVTDVYSAQEVGIVATQCPDHPHYHVQSESILVEVLKDDGTPCREGEVGRLVLTDLHNFATPLIRYDIGDFAELGGPCSCGRSLPVLKRITGRVRNMLRLPSGDVTWPLIYWHQVGSEVPEVHQFQLAQTGPAELCLRLVCDAPMPLAREEVLKAAVLRRLGQPMALSIDYRDSIPRLPNGKYEDFVCELEAS